MEGATEFNRLLDRLKETENPENRIEVLQSALAIEPTVEDWSSIASRRGVKGRLLNELGNTYLGRTNGDRQDNISQAIVAYTQALEFLKDAGSEVDWARTQELLAFGHLQSTTEMGQDHAMTAWRAALSVWTREGHPEEWARMHWNLGSMYAQRDRGDLADNLNRAEEMYKAALTVFTRDQHTHAWEAIQDNLGKLRTLKSGRPSQPDKIVQQDGEFAKLVNAWSSKALRPEQIIPALERALELEPLVQKWSFENPRNEIKGGLLRSLGNAYAQRLDGDAEKAFVRARWAYEESLRVRTRTAFPAAWANTMNDLGILFAKVTIGDRTENIEQAIKAFAEALSSLSAKEHREQWMSTQRNLALAYSSRRKGNPADNQERVIEAKKAVLSVYGKDTSPKEWAQIQTELARLYYERASGDRADNLESALEAAQAALSVITQENRQAWIDVHTYLAAAYTARIKGDRADNLDCALVADEAALVACDRKDNPTMWARTIGNLGVDYLHRIKGSPAENVDRAIWCFGEALGTLDRSEAPTIWAHFQHNLGTAYADRTRGDLLENREKALAAYRSALEVRTREKYPAEWAETTANLGVLYAKRIKDDKASNLDCAITILESTLGEYGEQSYPKDRSRVNVNLASACLAAAKASNDDDKLEKALVHCRRALSGATLDSDARHYLTVHRLLGSIFLRKGDLISARDAYARAEQAFTSQLHLGLQEAGLANLVGEAGDVFEEFAYVLAAIGDLSGAFAKAMAGRGRQLNLMKRRIREAAADTSLSNMRGADEIIERFKSVLNPAVLTTILPGLNLMRERGLEFLDKAAADAGRKDTTTPDFARALLRDGDAMLVPIVTSVGGYLLVLVANQKDLSATCVPGLNDDAIKTMLWGEDGWFKAYAIQYETQGDYDHHVEEWLTRIRNLRRELWELLGASAHRELSRCGVGQGAKVVWFPTGPLGAVPLGLAEDPHAGRCLCDLYEVTYAASLEALGPDGQRDNGRHSLAVVANPTGDLPFTEVEAQLVAKHFKRSRRSIVKGTATTRDGLLEALKGKSYWHFACHAKFHWENAQETAFVLSGENSLNVDQLVRAKDLGRPALVVLSACETGLYDIHRNQNEFIGLPTTFQALGATGVIATLWQVDDRATALLMARFYELHLAKKVAPAAALRLAQAWLRDATRSELASYVKGKMRASKSSRTFRARIMRGSSSSRFRPIERNLAPPDAANTALSWLLSFRRRRPVERPFAHPYYWGAFIYFGV